MVRNTCAGADQRFVPRKRAGGIIAALAFMSAGVHAAEWKVAPRLDLGESYTDNVTLAPSSSAKSDWITQVTPGISIEGSGSRLRLKADYALQNLIYANESSRNSFYHQLNANANATLVENALFLDARGNIQQQATSLLAPISNNNLNPGNVTDVSSYSVSPYLLHKFGSTAVGELRYTHDDVSSSAGGLSDSKSDRVNLKLNSGQAFYQLGWGVAYGQEKIDYVGINDVDSKDLSANLSYRLTSKVNLLATYGYEKNNYIAINKPEGSYWNVGFAWNPTTLTNLAASYGKRFFGTTYALNLNHMTPNTTWQMSYGQDITTTRQLEFENKAQYFYAGCTPDTAKYGFLNDPSCPPLAIIPFVQGVLTNETFVNKSFQGSVDVRAGKSVYILSAFNVIRELQTSAATDKQHGISGQWKIRLSRRDDGNLGLGWSRNQFQIADRTDAYRYVTLGVTHRLEKKLNGSVDFRHTLRDSNIEGNEYIENALSGHLLWTF